MVRRAVLVVSLATVATLLAVPTQAHVDPGAAPLLRRLFRSRRTAD